MHVMVPPNVVGLEGLLVMAKREQVRLAFIPAVEPGRSWRVHG